MTRYLLDTNVVSDFVRGNAAIGNKLSSLPPGSIFLSSIVVAELSYGLAKRPGARRINSVIENFLLKSEVLPWDREVARVWGVFRADLEKAGRMLQPHDMLIAAHAVAGGMVLVSNDRAFEAIAGLRLENWAIA